MRRCSKAISRATWSLLLALSGIGAAGCASAPAGDSVAGETTGGETGTDTGTGTAAIPADPVPLSAVPVPQPTGGDIIDAAAAVRLGKALFWDTQVGSDGQTACASCHHHAGADDRVKGAIHPGPDGKFEASSGPGAAWDGREIGSHSDDRVGSPGVAVATFVGIDPDPSAAADVCKAGTSPLFGAERQVTDRNAPTVIGAVFYRELFWDGRANHRFNGNDPFGDTENSTKEGLLDQDNAALASQAMGPVSSPAEMACLGRGLNGPNGLGKKLLARVPLGQQRVSASDGALGSLSAAPDNGLTVTYQEMIDAAFAPEVAGKAEEQFSRIFGQAIQAYEATLIPDQTPFDDYLAGDSSAMTEQQIAGWNAFKNPRAGGCFDCHAGPELSDATVGFAKENGLIDLLGGDQGFHNVGASMTADDLGRAAVGPSGVSWSVSGSELDRGAFKTPSLRNMKLTAPYMHNGSVADLDGIVNFYGDHKVQNKEEPLDVEEITLYRDDRTALKDFLLNALTDCRVEKERAPFDHPSLPMPNGVALPEVGADGTGSCP